MLVEIPDRIRQAGQALVGGGCGRPPLQVGAGGAAPQLPERGPPLRSVHLLSGVAGLHITTPQVDRQSHKS